MTKGDASRGRGIRGDGRSPFRIVLAAIGLALIIVAAFILMALRKPPRPAEADFAAYSEPAGAVDADTTPAVIQGWGVVSPKVEVNIMPEVAGKVTFIHSGLKAGGLIRAGERMVQIDPRDYELAVRQARAVVAEAQARLAAVTTEADVVRRGWRQLNPEAPPDSSLAIGEPQIQQTRAALESAQARLALAELQLERTSISLPFGVLVAAKEVDLGQYVAVGQPLAKVYGIDAFEVEVPLADADLAGLGAWEAIFPIHADGRETQRIPADVRMTLAGRPCTWQGYVLRAAGRVEGGSQTIPVVVEIPRPLDASGDKPPLLPGAFVQVLIAGGTRQEADERVAR